MIATPQQQTPPDPLGAVRERLEADYERLLERRENGEAGNNKVLETEDEDNPQEPPYETVRADELLDRYEAKLEAIDLIENPTEELVVQLEREVDLLKNEAEDITLEP